MPKLANYTTKYRAKLIASTYGDWVRPGTKVLDIGCGTGIVAATIKELKGVNIHGCDIQDYSITKIKFRKMTSFSKLPYKRVSFDVAMFNDVLHHTDYDNQSVLIKESLRVASETLIFELKPTWVARIFDFGLNKFHNPTMNIPFTYRTDSQWEALFKEMKVIVRRHQFSKPALYPFTHFAYKLSPKQT